MDQPIYLSSAAAARAVGITRQAVLDAERRGSLIAAAWVSSGVEQGAALAPLFSLVTIEQWRERVGTKAAYRKGRKRLDAALRGDAV